MRAAAVYTTCTTTIITTTTATTTTTNVTTTTTTSFVFCHQEHPPPSLADIACQVLADRHNTSMSDAPLKRDGKQCPPSVPETQTQTAAN